MMTPMKNLLLVAGMMGGLLALPMAVDAQPRPAGPSAEGERADAPPPGERDDQRPRWQGPQGSPGAFTGWRTMRFLRESMERAVELRGEAERLGKMAGKLDGEDEASERRRRIHQLRAELLPLEKQEFVEQFRSRIEELLEAMEEAAGDEEEKPRLRSSSSEGSPRILIVRNLREAMERLREAASDFDSLHEALTTPPDFSKLVPPPHTAARKGWHVERIEREIGHLRKRLGHLTEELERLSEEESGED